MKSIFLAGTILLVSSAAPASSFNLSQYTSSNVFALNDPGNANSFILNSEASAITFNPITDSLFVIGDEGEYLVEVNRTGETLSSMRLSGFEDTEGLTFRQGQLLIAEERIQDIFAVDYVAGGSVDRSSLTSWDIGAFVGNVGLEGISYDAVNDQVIGVKERFPQAIYEIALGTAPTTIVNNIQVPNGLDDIADVSVLTAIQGLDPSEMSNLLILSQQSSLLIETDRAGNILSQLDLSFFSNQAEGITVDSQGNIYIVGESYFDQSSGVLINAPALLSLQAVPLPAAVYFLGSALFALIGIGRRKVIH